MTGQKHKISCSYVLNRYQTEISKLPESQRQGGLEQILLKFWDLMVAFVDPVLGTRTQYL
jgi:hypothetical protein